jgi:CheY-like chemotaxis protein
VSEADSGLACMERLGREVPDLILLDIAMPQMDGWTVARAIRARGLAHLPILLVSANAFENLHERNEPPLVNDFVVKPVSYNELLAKIRQHLKLDWVAQATPEVPPSLVPVNAQATAQPLMLVPPHDKLATLLELGSIGYAKEILRQLDAMERQQPAYLPFTTELRQLVKQFRLNEYVTRIKELIRHDLNDVR